jgi:tight adherence protein C
VSGILALACFVTGFIVAWVLRTGYVMTQISWANKHMEHKVRYWQSEAIYARNIAGDALRQFAARSDLEEIRGLASVVVQVERFGASLVKSLQAHAEGLRSRRILRAEELAQKAVVKMLFPTILFIMPAIFIVILGPTTVMLMEQFEGIAEPR